MVCFGLDAEPLLVIVVGDLAVLYQAIAVIVLQLLGKKEERQQEDAGDGKLNAGARICQRYECDP